MQQPLISADSHVIEPADLWEKNLPQAHRGNAPRYPSHGFQVHEGGTDPGKRIGEMAMDGVSGEVLYPSLTLDQFGITDPAFQEACFRVYNDWLIDYCAHSPERLFGIAAISAYNIDNAIREVERCKKGGMKGVILWQSPPENLSFASDHYDRLWATAQDLAMPVNLHILTGEPFPLGLKLTPEQRRDGAFFLTDAVSKKLLHAATALTHLMGSGALERFPRLKIVLVENEASWLPFFVSQCDRYATRAPLDGRMKMLPSDYFQRQVFTTFFNDPPVRWFLEGWGAGNCMWSNDFPHRNSTWPKSREVIERDLGSLDARIRDKLLHQNVIDLYHLPAAVATLPQ